MKKRYSIWYLTLISKTFNEKIRYIIDSTNYDDHDDEMSQLAWVCGLVLILFHMAGRDCALACRWHFISIKSFFSAISQHSQLFHLPETNSGRIGLFLVCYWQYTPRESLSLFEKKIWPGNSNCDAVWVLHLVSIRIS